MNKKGSIAVTSLIIIVALVTGSGVAFHQGMLGEKVDLEDVKMDGTRISVKYASDINS